MKTCDLLPIVVLLALPSLGLAQERVDPGALRGLAGVAVAVSNIPQEAERDGLFHNTLQTDVELRLRMAGIRVLTGEQWLNALGQPTLNISVGLVKSRSDVYAKSVEVTVTQNVLLTRNASTFVRAATWQSFKFVGISNSSILQRDIRDNVADSVDEFINAFLAANPR